MLQIAIFLFTILTFIVGGTMSKDNNCIITSSALGATAGTIYGFRHPSEKSCQKIARLKPTISQAMKDYRDCFDIMNAGQAVREGKLSIDEYKTVNSIRTAIHNAYEKEKQLADILNTPMEKRPMTFRQAVREANKTRPQLYKAAFKLNKKLRDKLVELNVFDIEKFSNTMNAVKKKAVVMYKELAKSSAKYLLIGTAAGAVTGCVLNKISNK